MKDIINAAVHLQGALRVHEACITQLGSQAVKSVATWRFCRLHRMLGWNPEYCSYDNVYIYVYVPDCSFMYIIVSC
jgi:hypothetical protein